MPRVKLPSDQVYINQFPMDIVQAKTNSAVHQIAGVLVERDGTGRIYRASGQGESAKVILAEEFEVTAGLLSGGVTWELDVVRNDGAAEEWVVRPTGGCKCKYKNNVLGTVRDMRKVSV